MNEWTRRESLNGREVTEGERNLGVGSKWNRCEVAAREGCLEMKISGLGAVGPGDKISDRMAEAGDSGGRRVDPRKCRALARSSQTMKGAGVTPSVEMLVTQRTKDNALLTFTEKEYERTAG